MLHLYFADEDAGFALCGEYSTITWHDEYGNPYHAYHARRADADDHEIQEWEDEYEEKPYRVVDLLEVGKPDVPLDTIVWHW